MHWALHSFLIVFTLNVVSSEKAAFNTRDYVYDPKVDVWYNFHSTPTFWLNATIICGEENARLAMPKNTDEYLAIKALMDENQYYSYILVNSHDNFEENDYISQDHHIQYFYHNWYDNQPNDPNERCVQLTYDGYLHDFPCDFEYSYFCQRDNHSIIHSTIITDDKAYFYEPSSKKFIKLHMQIRNWNHARAICNAEGGRLSIIESNQQEKFMVQLFNDTRNLWPRSEPLAYIGFHDYFRGGEYFTIDDKPLEDGYINWAPEKPNNGSQRCGCMTPEGGISNCDCFIRSQFFCERQS